MKWSYFPFIISFLKNTVKSFFIYIFLFNDSFFYRVSSFLTFYNFHHLIFFIFFKCAHFTFCFELAHSHYSWYLISSNQFFSFFFFPHWIRFYLMRPFSYFHCFVVICHFNVISKHFNISKALNDVFALDVAVCAGVCKQIFKVARLSVRN